MRSLEDIETELDAKENAGKTIPAEYAILAIGMFCLILILLGFAALIF